MNNSKLETIRTLKYDADSLRTLERDYVERIASPNIDKYKFGFDSPDRTLSAFEFPVALISYTGVYGSSSVSAFGCVRVNAQVRDAFYRWLNNNRELVLHGIADELENEAATLFDEAKAEIKRQADELEQLIKDCGLDNNPSS